MKKIFLVIALLCSLSIGFSQDIKLSFGPYQKEVIISNNTTQNLGNFSLVNQLIAYSLVFENLDSSSPLEISNFQFSDNDPRVEFFSIEKQYTVKNGESIRVQIFYYGSGSIDTATETLTFATNDPNNRLVNLSFILNPDQGDLDLLVEDKPLVNNEINVGDISINSVVSEVITIKNKGKGYMKVSGVSNVHTENQLSYSYQNENIFSPNEAYNNLISFRAIKKGPIHTTFEHLLERGVTDNEVVSIVGNVLAPITSCFYNGQQLNDAAIINLPDNEFTSEEYDFTIKNTGDYTLNLGSLRIEDDTENEFYLAHNGGYVLAPNETKRMTLKFTPTSIGPKKIKLKVYSDGYETSHLTFELNLLVQAPLLAITDTNGLQYDIHESFPLGTSKSGEAIINKIVLKNIGNKELSITAIEELVDYSYIEILRFPNASIPAGLTDTLQVRYTPPLYREHKKRGFLKISSNNLRNKTIRLELGMKNEYANLDITINKTDFANKAEYNFNGTSVLIPKKLKLILKNKGSAVLALTNIEILNNAKGYYSISQPPTKTKLASGEIDSLIIRFAPLDDGEIYSSKLKLNNNDYKDEEFIINLTGWAQKPYFEIFHTDSKLPIFNNAVNDLGIINEDEPRSVHLSIKNVGYETLSLSNILLSQVEGAKADIIGEIPDQLSIGEQIDFEVRIKVETKGNKQVTFSLETSDRDKPNYNVLFGFNSVVSSTHDTVFDKIKIFPNPSVSNFNINFGVIQSEIQLSIYNTTGKNIINKTVTNTDNASFSINEETGIYFLVLNLNGTTKTFKIYKN